MVSCIGKMFPRTKNRLFTRVFDNVMGNESGKGVLDVKFI
jgi:hypothetical protein